ncbi:peptidyl-prolyl cis-trans isomerase CYP57 [Selaginella moellendorffii]|uniref:peptidyl-prolyl cis-trans isomerase CYP57 n=1 Tax=Selaginella moellendorffii TaxID=88036 RepID=UPI000D1CA23B|nr:peptidyl-prolyl cis-trans isomerase CYP57 [Selaginella moellendorffii]|eukprot:XP_024540575.1 peptidyl-prolyl cis-trans isomerase CYP57 [Selaginella moellendorffii]
MSSVYVLEPLTKGKVVLHTSSGPLDIELWAREAPQATRNFVQLCMEGYYNNTLFHRVIPSFLVQGGDPTGTGKGGESIYGEPFPDEIHTRLKFRHRGFVACANEGRPNSNGSQFFITLDRCDWINGKHTIFGKVTGDTIYNLLKIAECDPDEDDRPTDPHSVLSTEVVWNPFDDIVPRKLHKPVDKSGAKTEEKPVKQKKRLNLLSFGEEALQEDEEASVIKEKIKSSHDVLDDPRLLKSQVPGPETKEDKQRELSAVRQALANKNPLPAQEEEDVASDGEDQDQTFDEKMRQKLLEKKRLWDPQQETKAKAVAENKKSKVIQKPEKDDDDDEDEDEEEEESDIRKDKLVIKKRGLGSEARAEIALKTDVEMQLLTPQEQRRQKVKQHKRNLGSREETTMALLDKFREKLSSHKAAEPDKDEASDILSHKLKFELDRKDKMARKEALDHYVVVDPLLEKGKEQFNKIQAKMKRRNREWAGKSFT